MLQLGNAFKGVGRLSPCDTCLDEPVGAGIDLREGSGSGSHAEQQTCYKAEWFPGASNHHIDLLLGCFPDVVVKPRND
jgi:hypothetical protein